MCDWKLMKMDEWSVVRCKLMMKKKKKKERVLRVAPGTNKEKKMIGAR
jgi:hypothetical protein